MRKIIAVILVACLMGCMGLAYAAEPIKVSITPVDYQTGKAVNKTYVENELFRLKVNIDLPRFVDLSNMQMVVEVDGVEIAGPEIVLASGDYYIEGIVKAQPAKLTVKIKDMAFDNAETAEELYNAMQQDRTVSATYYFYSAAVTENEGFYIPKTGDASIIGPIVAMACVGVVAWPKRRR